MSLLRVAVVVPTIVLLTASLFAQDKNAAPEGKVCVATVGNASTTSAFVEHMTERLVRSLKQDRVEAFGMRSRTSNHYPLQPSQANGQESGQKECKFILLTQVRDPGQHPLERRVPEISIGGRVPSTDASDPMGGSSGPVHRANLHVAFALFRVGRAEAVVDTYVMDRPAANVSDTLLEAMDREASRVSSEMKKVLLPE